MITIWHDIILERVSSEIKTKCFISIYKHIVHLISSKISNTRQIIFMQCWFLIINPRQTIFYAYNYNSYNILKFISIWYFTGGRI